MPSAESEEQAADGVLGTLPAAWADGMVSRCPVRTRCASWKKPIERRKPRLRPPSAYGAVREKIWKNWGRPEDAPDLEQVLPVIEPGERRRLLEQSRQLAAQSPLPNLDAGPGGTDPLARQAPGNSRRAPWFSRSRRSRCGATPWSMRPPGLFTLPRPGPSGAAVFWPWPIAWTWGSARKRPGWPGPRRTTCADSERSAVAGENPFLKSLVQ